MPDPREAPDVPREEEDGYSLLASISREMVRAMKKYYGKGPVQAKSYLVDDLLFVVMRGGTTTAEKTMVASDQEDAVRAFRQRFQNEMEEQLTSRIEQLTGRKVVNYQSQILFDPDIAVDIFVFDRPVAQDAREETAASLTDPESGIGEIAGDDVEVSSDGSDHD